MSKQQTKQSRATKVRKDRQAQARRAERKALAAYMRSPAGRQSTRREQQRFMESYARMMG